MRAADLNPETQAKLFGNAAPPAAKKSKKTEARDALAFQIRAFKLPETKTEHLFATDLRRKWRFDFAWPQFKLAFEVEGLVVERIGGRLVVTGRHASIAGMKEDMAKYNSAGLLGWTVLRGDQTMIKKGEAIAMIQRVLFARGWVGA